MHSQEFRLYEITMEHDIVGYQIRNGDYTRSGQYTHRWQINSTCKIAVRDYFANLCSFLVKDIHIQLVCRGT